MMKKEIIVFLLQSMVSLNNKREKKKLKCIFYINITLFIEPISVLKRIFQTLPFSLSPNYFYHRIPAGFKVSKHPGFLTSEGGLLFCKDAAKEKYTRAVDQNRPIGELLWDSQLVVPVWTFVPHRFLTVMSILMGWLYLDLPQYITPTPGIAPSILIQRVIDSVAVSAAAAESSPSQYDTPIWQWVFFAMHIAKIIFIFAMFQTGTFNPISLNPFTNRKLRTTQPTLEMLNSIGWTNVKRATPEEWRSQNSKNMIAEEGGFGKLLQNKGKLKEIANAGIFLTDGEGLATPKPSKKENSKEGSDNSTKVEMIDKDGKFHLTDEYFYYYYAPLAKAINDENMDSQSKAELMSYYRRYGPKKATPELKEIYLKRLQYEKKQNDKNNSK